MDSVTVYVSVSHTHTRHSHLSPMNGQRSSSETYACRQLDIAMTCNTAKSINKSINQSSIRMSIYITSHQWSCQKCLKNTVARISVLNTNFPWQAVPLHFLDFRSILRHFLVISRQVVIMYSPWLMGSPPFTKYSDRKMAEYKTLLQSINILLFHQQVLTIPHSPTWPQI